MEKRDVQQGQEASSSMREFHGPTVLTRGFFAHHDEPVHLLVMGPLTVCPDVPAEEVENKIGKLTVYGPLTCPDYLLNAIAAKAQSVYGPTITYHCSPTSRVAVDSLTLDENYLHTLDDGSELAVIGSLRLQRVLPNDLLKRKLRKLYVLRGIRCYEENVPIIAQLVDRIREMTVIPSGFEIVEWPLVLDNAQLASLPGKKLYCTDRVQIETDVDAAKLDRHLEALISEDIVFCPLRLKDMIFHKCRWPETRVVLYEGALWIVKNGRELSDHHLDYLEGKATLVVYGELTVDPDVDPQLLADRLAKVHNLGEIRCTRAQMPVIRERLGLQDGELVDSTQIEPADEGCDAPGQGPGSSA